MEKKEIRSFIAKKKKALTPSFIETYSDSLADLLANRDFYKNAPVLYTYLAYNEEIRTERLIRRAWADGKRVAVPKVLSPAEGLMEFYYIDSFEEVSPGYYGIPEPKGAPARLANDQSALMLMPGLAFDRAHNRIGYGGGFYDRYLARKEAAGASFIKAAFAYEFQIFETLPSNVHDRRPDYILCAGEIF